MQLERWINLARVVSREVSLDKKHICLIIKKKELLSIGTNIPKTHPKALEMGYAYPWLHAELDAYNRIQGDESKLTLLSLRFNTKGHLGMAKPCKYCLPWCSRIFTNIYYSSIDGDIRRYQ